MEKEKQKEDSQEETDITFKMLMDLKKNHDPFCAICKEPEEIKNPSQKMEKEEREMLKENEEQELFLLDLSKNTKFVNAL